MNVCVTHAEFSSQLRRVGISQAAFARLCGVTTMAVNHWCRGRREVPQWAWALTLALEKSSAKDLARKPTLQWHETLGVFPNASPQQIKSARAKMARKYHPDVGGGVDAMQRINAAHDVGMALRD